MMSNVTKATAQDLKFDPDKLEKLAEPFLIRVEKLKGNTRQPIPLPQPEDPSLAPGEGWDKAGVRAIEQWIVRDWSGGGMYEVVVTDAASQTMRWRFFYPPSEYPERTPPTLAGAAAPAVAAFQPQVRPNMSAFPGGLPPGPAFIPTQAPAPQQTPYYYQQQPAYVPAPTGYPPPAGYDPGRAALEGQLRDLQAAMAREREAAMQQRYEAELARQREASRSDVARLEQKFAELTGLVTKLAEGAAGSRANPEVEALRESNRQMQERMEAERREREAERRERELREHIATQALATQRQLETMQAQFVQFQQANSSRQHDPMIQMFQEQMRLQIEAMKDQARGQQAALDRMSSFMMTPDRVIALAKESGQTMDQLAGQMTRAFGGIIDVQGKVMEQMAQSQGGGDSPITVIKEGIERATSVAEKWFGAKAREAVATQQSQAEIARAQAQAMTAQAMMNQEPIIAPPMPPPPSQAPTQVHTPPAPPAQGQLSGPKIPGMQVEYTQHSQGSGGAPAASNGAAPSSQAIQTGTTPPPVKRMGRSDEEWFGMLLPQVKQLREGVHHCLESALMKPERRDKTGRLVGIAPDQAASYVLQAVQQVMQKQIPIPAVVDLFLQDRHAEFVDVLLPDAPSGYRGDVIQSIHNLISGVADDGGDDDDDDEDGEDDEDGDDRKHEERSAPKSPTKAVPAQA